MAYVASSDPAQPNAYGGYGGQPYGPAYPYGNGAVYEGGAGYAPYGGGGGGVYPPPQQQYQTQTGGGYAAVSPSVPTSCFIRLVTD